LAVVRATHNAKIAKHTPTHKPKNTNHPQREEKNTKEKIKENQ